MMKPARHPRGPLVSSIRRLLTALLAIAATASTGWTQPIAWDRLAEGLAVAVWTPPAFCSDVPPLLAIDIEPGRYRFSVHYFREAGLEEPLDISAWQVRTGHDLVFNAGLFRENFAYLGLLYGNGRSLGGKQHGTWLGLFVAEPIGTGQAPARIIDLSYESFDGQNPSYREVAQSLMLIDQAGTIRVRKSGKQAQQTIVAEQDNGHILLFKTTEPAALYDLGQCLHEAFPTIRRAMAMDGGASSDAALAPSFLSSASGNGNNSAWRPYFGDRAAAHIRLPAVIGISPREQKPAGQPKPTR